MTDVTEDVKDETVVETPTEEVKEREVHLDPEQALEWGDIAVAGHPKVEDPEEEVENETVEEEEAKVEPEEIPFIPTPIPDDPGEYIPADYSFEVEVEGKKTKIESVEQAETFMDENADKFTAPELLKIIRQTSKMESKLEGDKSDYEKRKEEFDTKKAESDAQLEGINSIASEITYLVSKGKLPAVDPKYLNANWQDPEIAKQPGVKEQVELLNYMRDENTAREKAGLKPISSALDAYNAWQLETKNTEEVDEKKQRAEARKNASSRVAGISPNPTSIAPKGIAVGRTLALNDLDSF